MAILPTNHPRQVSRSPLMPPVLWAALSLAAVLTVVALGFLVALWSSGRGESVSYPLSVSVFASIETPQFSVEIRPEASPPALDVRDGDGRLLATIQTGHSPDVLYRKSSGELLVSSIRDVNGTAVASVEFLDVANGFRVTRSIELADREGYHLYFPAIVLSGDESQLAYTTRQLRASPECRPGRPINAEMCDVWAVVVVNIADGITATAATLMQGCGVPILAPASGPRVTATCSRAASLSVIDGQGAVVRSVDLSALAGNDPDPLLLRNRVVTVAGFLGVDDAVIMVFADGRMANSATGTTSRIIPTGKRVANRGSSVLRLPDETLIVPFKAAYHSPEADGYTLVAADGTVQEVREVPGLRGVAPMGARGFTAAMADGRRLLADGTQTRGHADVEVLLGYAR